MLKYQLLQPQLLHALGQAGHGNRVLLADANYRFVTGAQPAAEKVFLNLSPGLLTIPDVLRVLLDTISIEAAFAMRRDDGLEAPIAGEYRSLLPQEIELTILDRSAFYEQVMSPETILVIATGEQQLFANLLLVIGVVTTPDRPHY